jgi:cytochrome c2
LGIGFQLLILWICFGGILATPVEVDAAGCLDCHPAHYVETADCIQCHRGYPGTKRIEIAHYRLIAGRFASFGFPGSLVVKRGEQQLTESACRRCHISGGRGNRLATNLDRSLLNSSPGELLQAIREPVLFMPRFNFTEAQMVAVVNAILAGAATLEPPEKEVPQVVHFSDDFLTRTDPFSKHCDRCHRLLTHNQGGMGWGDIGPNLSGLFSENYPLNFGKGERWSAKNLQDWLNNPLKFRPLTQMAPLKLTPEELLQLDLIFMDTVE